MEVAKTEHSANAVPLAIVGIGCLFPKADDLDAYWANIRDGIDAIAEIPSTHWRIDDYFNADPKSPDMTYGRRGGFLSPIQFNPMEYNLPPNILEAVDTSQLLGLVAAGKALKDAGYGPEREFDRNRTSVILGVTGALELVIPLGARLGHPAWRAALKDAGVADEVAEDVIQRIAASYVPWQENSFPGLLGNVVAGRISKHFDLGGTNCVVDAACASSFSAMHLAAMELASGKADMVVTGGIDTFNSIFMYMCFSKTPALSPSGDAKPFDSVGDGTILGEGLGIVVVKRLADAERDKDRIYAVIRGVGTSSDGKGEAIYAPSSAGQKKALVDAYQRAGVSPESISLIEAHGTGTKVGDAVEVNALREVFGEADSPRCCLGSVKSQIGHTKAAAGAAGLIKASLALHHKVIPPTIKVTKPLEEVTRGRTPFYLAKEKRPWVAADSAPRRAAVSAFGFGGSNFHVVLEEYRPHKEEIDWDGNVQILALSGKDAAALRASLAAIPKDAQWNELRRLAAESRKAFDGSAPCRIALVLQKDKGSIASMAANADTMLKEHPAGTWSTPDGIHYSSAAADPRGTAILFPGQGAQYCGMARDLACSFPAMLDTLTMADNGFTAEHGKRLSDAIYPPTPFSREATESQENDLRATETAQPAIGAASIGIYKILHYFGLEADATAGHSFGELTALCAAGRLSEDEFHRLSRLRGRLMGSGNGDRGGMLAVSATLEQTDKIIVAEKLGVVIANRNAPTQQVLSGPSGEIERADVLFTAGNISCKRLSVSAAFHSRLVADAAVPFRAAMEAVEFRPGSMPVFANSNASPYPDEAAPARDLLANQLASPVEFVAMIEAMYGSGVRTFVETGPGSRLSGLVRAILGDREHTALSVDSSAGKRPGMVDLARTLAQLAVLGKGVNLALWDGDFVPAPANAGKPALTVPISGANYVKPRPALPPSTRSAAVRETVQPVVAGETSRAVENMHQPQPAAKQAVPREALGDSLRMTGESMAMLLKMQEETARVHRLFLEGQETAARTFQTLLDQQRRIFHGPGDASVRVPIEVPATLPQAAEPRPQPKAQASPQAAISITPASAAVSAAAAATPVVAATAVPAISSAAAMATLVAVVSEKTGYPTEMLEPEMALDSDLGIDSIKRVEILSAIRERLPEAPAIGPEHLGSLRTLADIAAHLASAPASAAAAATPVVAATAVPAISSAAAMATLVAVVSEKTGYPTEMLEPEMALDSDLGIDSIKRVEILSAIRERLPEAPAIGPEHLGSLRTLADIAAHLASAPVSAAAAATPVVAATAVPAFSSAAAMATLVAVVSEKTGYPTEMLEPEMALDSDLGIDSIKRVEILSAIREKLPEAPAIGPEHLGSLRTLADIAAHLASAPAAPGSSEEAEAPRPETAASRKTSTHLPVVRSRVRAVPMNERTEKEIDLPDGSLLWVVDDGSTFVEELCSRIAARGVLTRRLWPSEASDTVPPANLAGLVIPAPEKGTDDLFLSDAFLILKNAGPALRGSAAAGNALFVTLSRLDGSFGCGDSGAICDPLSGGLAGLVKTAAREWPEVSCKAIDTAVFADQSEMARAISREMFLSGPVEVGITPTECYFLELEDMPPAQLPAQPPLSEGDVVVVTGGARGVTAATAVSLTRAYRPFLVLLGRSPEPTAEAEWLLPLAEESAIKRAILVHAAEKLHPRDIEERYRVIVASREIRATLEAISAAGGKAVYRSVDIRDNSAVAAVMESVRAEYGPVRGVVHGAGVLADRLIADKSREQFSSVFATKVEGLRSILQATRGDDLHFIALFSSTTGRFGRIGQVDYAVANEVINKLALVEQRLRPGCRTVSINWGPWDGGMVTPALKKVFAAEGIGLIDLDAGGDFLVREIGATGAPAEIIAMAGTTATVTVPQQAAPSAALSEAVTLNLTLDGYPFLRSHVLDGRAVLPMAVIVEWLSHGALHGNPGFRFHGFNDLRICKGVVFDEDTSCALRVMAGKAVKRDAFHLVPVELISSGKDGRSVLHARAEIVLAGRLPEGIRSIIELPSTPYHPLNGELYDRERLFHGPELHGIEEVTGCGETGIAAMVKGAPPPSAWIRQPLRSLWITDPLVIDSAFQMMILWSFERFGAGSLPCFAGRYRQFQETFPKEGVQVVIRITAERENSAHSDMEFLDRSSGKLVARLEDYECVIDPSLKQAFRRNRLAQSGPVQMGAA